MDAFGIQHSAFDIDAAADYSGGLMRWRPTRPANWLRDDTWRRASDFMSAVRARS